MPVRITMPHLLLHSWSNPFIFCLLYNISSEHKFVGRLPRPAGTRIACGRRRQMEFRYLHDNGCV